LRVRLAVPPVALAAVVVVVVVGVKVAALDGAGPAMGGGDGEVGLGQ
jgi:hypothetical protein